MYVGDTSNTTDDVGDASDVVEHGSENLTTYQQVYEIQESVVEDADTESENEELTTDQQVNEALFSLSASSVDPAEQPLPQAPPLTTMPVEFMPSDLKEMKTTSDFMSAGCGCQNQCYTNFDQSYIQKIRLTCLELPRNVLDSTILGQLLAFSNTTASIITESGHASKQRERVCTSYYHQGKPVCANMFFFYPYCG